MNDTITIPLNDILKHVSPEALTQELLARVQTYSTAGQFPRIGAIWPSGGVYAGIVRGVNGAPDAHLIVHGEEKEEISYGDAMKWATQLAEHEQKSWMLPTESEHAVLLGNVPELFKREYYWSCEQYAADDAYAWCQGFSYGYQGTNPKSYHLRAKAVRRSPIYRSTN